MIKGRRATIKDGSELNLKVLRGEMIRRGPYHRSSLDAGMIDLTGEIKFKKHKKQGGTISILKLTPKKYDNIACQNLKS